MANRLELVVFHITLFCFCCQTTYPPSKQPTLSPRTDQMSSSHSVLTDPNNVPFWICVIAVVFVCCLFGSIWMCLCIRCRLRALRTKYIITQQQQQINAERFNKVKSISESAKSPHHTSSEIKLKSPKAYSPSTHSFDDALNVPLPSPPLSTPIIDNTVSLHDIKPSDITILHSTNIQLPSQSIYDISQKYQQTKSKLKTDNKTVKKRHHRRSNTEPVHRYELSSDDYTQRTGYPKRKIRDFKRRAFLIESIRKRSTDGDKSTHWYSDGDDDIYLVNQVEKEYAKYCDEMRANKQNKEDHEREFSMTLQNNLNEEKLITDNIVYSMENDLSPQISPSSMTAQMSLLDNTMDNTRENTVVTAKVSTNELYAAYCGLE